jgi:hypothetical protein
MLFLCVNVYFHRVTTQLQLINIIIITCFERNPLIIRRSTTQIVHMQPLVSSLAASDRLVQPLRKEFNFM